MPKIRLILERDDRVEIHEVETEDLVLGASEEADLLLEDPSVDAIHARLSLRRERLILIDLGARAGVRLLDPRGEVVTIGAPVVLEERARFELGRVRIQAVPSEDPLGVDAPPPGFGPLVERVSADPDLRRFFAPREGLELAVLAPLPAEITAAWRARAGGSWGGRPYVATPSAPGVRLARILEAVERGRLQLPLEAQIAIVAQLGDAAAEIGVHGAIEPRTVHLGVDGSLRLVTPGPRPERYDEARRPFLSAERRYGAPPTAADDRFAIEVLAARLGAGAWPAPLAATPDLRAAAHGLGLDPSTAHLARVARLFEAVRPLARLRSEGLANSAPPA